MEGGAEPLHAPVSSLRKGDLRHIADHLTAGLNNAACTCCKYRQLESGWVWYAVECKFKPVPETFSDGMQVCAPLHGELHPIMP